MCESRPEALDKSTTDKGTTLVEVIVAIMLVSIAVMAVMSNLPQAWVVAGRTDHLGRAAGILLKELETNELLIMNPNQSVTTTTDPIIRTVTTSGQTTPQAGDVSYTVQTTIVSAGTNIWRVTVGVTWPGNATGISASVLVTRQEPFRS
jgi:hypothetical protein